MINSCFLKFKLILKNILKYFGYRLNRHNINIAERNNTININVGCGEYEIDGFVSVDYYSKSYYGSKKFDRVNYDMRNDNLPYEDNTLDTIYCSHVIEHVETEYVIKFISESFRTLKKKGVLRLVCPDAKYLYNKLLNNPEYFSWHKLYKSKNDGVLCFVNLIAEPKTYQANFGLNKNIFDFEYFELVEELKSGLKFNSEKSYLHINNWDFNRINKIAKNIGFNSIDESRYQGSFCATLRGNDIDLTHPTMSMYIDLQK